MKTFTKIILSVALGAIVILSIVVASVAWFTSNPEVNANDVTLESARTLTVSFGSGDVNNVYVYNGQKGNVATGADAPFIYEAGGFTINVTPSGDSKYGNVKVEFGTVSMNCPIGTVPESVLITDLFHVTACIYESTTATSGDDIYVKDPINNYMRKYVPATDTLLSRYRLISTNMIADDGIVMNSEDPTKPEYFSQGIYYLGFTYTFLPDEAYQTWLEACDPESPTTFSDIHGYEFAGRGSGDFIGVVSYTPYKAKYHYGLTRYTRSGSSAPYTYTESADGDYVRVVTDYLPYAEVTKYTSAEGAGAGAANGEYIKVGDSNEYVRFYRYNEKNGFPYFYHTYLGTEYRFTVACSIEEVSREA